MICYADIILISAVTHLLTVELGKNKFISYIMGQRAFATGDIYRCIVL